MKKRMVIMLVMVLILFGCSRLALFKDKSEPVEIIGLLPLDSRPANTQYPELLAQMLGIKLKIPSEYLDNFLTPANQDGLWQWLENETKDFKTLIINTSILFNGSLIETRNPRAYLDLDVTLEKLKAFCRQNKEMNIIVIDVLPRLLPSQFTDLWPYRDELTKYAIELDKSDLEGLKNPSKPSGLPPEIINEYLSIYSGSQKLLISLIEMVEEGLINHLLIGQDDAEKYGLANKIIRNSLDRFNEQIAFVHGADELSMLALIKTKIPAPELSLRILYGDPKFSKAFYPFEADSLENILAEKLNYLGLKEDPASGSLEIIHTNQESKEEVLKIMEENKSDYLGIMDIALTNKGDPSLWQVFIEQPDLFRKLNGYAGWNTASNTIGTELAHFVAVKHLTESNWQKDKKRDALQAYLNFKYIRFAEDFIYQGIVRNELNQILIAKGWDPNNLGDKKEEAQAILRELFEPYWLELGELFLGKHYLGHEEFWVKSISGWIYLPWPRTFEAKIDVTSSVNINILP